MPAPPRHPSHFLDDALDDIREEVDAASAKFPAFASAHEGYAIILEELDELWIEVKGNVGYGPSAYVEAVQVAAMAVRYLLMIKRRQFDRAAALGQQQQ
jgi:hypothetical protein